VVTIEGDSEEFERERERGALIREKDGIPLLRNSD